jgi:hypothetical protein
MAKKKRLPPSPKTPPRKRSAKPESAAAEPTFRNRIKELRYVPAAELAANPKNWRTHSAKQAGALVGVLQEIGIADAMIARECPDGTLQLIDGHLRRDVLKTGQVPVLVLDVTEAEADKLLLTLDPLAAMAGANNDALDSLMRDVETGSQELADMLTELAKQHEVSFTVTEGGDDGEKLGEDEAGVEVQPSFGVLVECTGEDQQREVFERLTTDGLKCRVLTL